MTRTVYLSFGAHVAATFGMKEKINDAGQVTEHAEL